jgi:lipopolysaccharide export system protein LptA
MVRPSKAAPYRWGVFVLVASTTAFAQQPEQGVSVEADSVSFDLGKGVSVYTRLAVTDGVVNVDAAEGTTTSEGANGIWDFRNGLRITIDAATLTAESGTLRYTDGRFTQVELLGTPVTLDGSTGSGSRPFRLTAGRISYDGQGLLTASNDAVFASNGMQIRNCSWIYDLSDKSVQGLAEADRKCTADVIVGPPAAR